MNNRHWTKFYGMRLVAGISQPTVFAFPVLMAPQRG